MTLYINTKDRNNICVCLKKDGKIVKSLSEENEYGSQILLPLIIKLLRKTRNKIESIEVETGPGSFTGIRVGVSVANALAYSLNIPVNGKKIETDLVY